MERAPEGTALYVHVPFCVAKCHYCDFFSVPAAGWDVSGVVEAILLEAAARAPRRPSTLFVGGGTPSLLDINQLARLFNGLHEFSEYRGSTEEVTIECNPESLDRDKAAAMLDLGVTRVSIGFQALDRSTLELFGRVHDTDQSLRAYEAVRAAGFSSVNIDLIYATPGHRPTSWRATLDRVLDLQPEHLSAYNLAFEQETLFSRWLAEGKIRPLDEELELELFAITRQLTASRGLAPYEISNYAQPGHQCQHNINYWNNGGYVGLGPSAASHVSGRRSGNTREIDEYTSRCEAVGEAEAWAESLGCREKLGETWWIGLRASRGVDPRHAREVARWKEPTDPALELATSLLNQGLLELRSERYCLSERGLPLADRISAEFLCPEKT